MTSEDLPKSLVDRLRFPDPVWVTRPCLPSLDDYARRLEEVWEARWLTNFGKLHEELEERLAEYLGVPSLELVSHGTSALLVALKALGLERGEVITTPFTFPATIHCLGWCGLEPVFCDVEEHTLTLDPERVSEQITDKTVAILGVHVYGTPCDTERLQKLARAHDLPVLYDAAHAFGVRRRGRSILLEGDASILSFHATKLFSTAEGGAAFLSNEDARKKFRLLRNFGIVDEETVAAIGINAKLSELHAALGLLQLDLTRDEIAGRKAVAQTYERELDGLPGLQIVPRPSDVEHNYAYFPVLIDEEELGMGRDELSTLLQRFNVFPRKYFYPLCSEHPLYNTLSTADPDNLPVATRAARRALCLPIYGALGTSAAQRIARILWHLHEYFRDRPTFAEAAEPLSSIRSNP